MNIKILLFLWVIILISCSEKPKAIQEVSIESKPKSYLRFKSLELEDLNTFKASAKNWKIVGGVSADFIKNRTISTTEGTGILVNSPEEGKKENLFTNFEHGDIEVELDVLMPKGSSSGLYFQGRYEIQLFDSWGVDSPTPKDMGGISQQSDDRPEDGEDRFIGAAPQLNAAKAPGLWQHFKVIFHAPKFDGSGVKIKNARFEEVWLNGMLIHEDVEVTGPTKSAAFKDEIPKAPLMIQGDDGPVAIKNINYKTYGAKRVALEDITMSEYENKAILLPVLDSLTPIRTIKTDTISALMVTGERPQKVLKYEGNMKIPIPGEYLFDLRLNREGGILLIQDDTIVNRNGDYSLDSLGLGKVTLEEGKVPFTFIYNKHRPWTNGFSLEVEGPEIQKHALQARNSLLLNSGKPAEKIMIEIDDETIAQRSFLMHNGNKRTHCISVGTPQGIHYAYDLEFGSLLKVWSGDFLDATPMWYSRGQQQLGIPAGFIVSFHGTPEFAELGNDSGAWPDIISDETDGKQMGYEFDGNGIPTFSHSLNNSIISDKMTPETSERSLKRSITVDGETEIWHKVAAGESIEKLTDDMYIINNESYFVDFSKSSLQPIIRESNGLAELLVKIPSGKQQINYSIIW